MNLYFLLWFFHSFIHPSFCLFPFLPSFLFILTGDNKKWVLRSADIRLITTAEIHSLSELGCGHHCSSWWTPPLNGGRNTQQGERIRMLCMKSLTQTSALLVSIIPLSSLSGHWFSSFFADLVTNFLIGPVNVGVPWCLDDLSPWLLLIYIPSLKEPIMFKCQICADCIQISISSPDFSPEPQTWMSSHLSEHFPWMTQTAWPVEIKTFLSTSQSCTSSSLVFFFLSWITNQYLPNYQTQNLRVIFYFFFFMLPFFCFLSSK